MGIVSRVPHRLLISVKRGKPNWTLLDVPGAEALLARHRVEHDVHGTGEPPASPRVLPAPSFEAPI